MSDNDDIELPIKLTVTEFDDVAVRRLQTAIDNCVRVEQPFLPITIMSPGGDLYALFAMIDLIQGGPIPCATIALGMAMSAGSVLLASGQKGYRFVAPSAYVMVHQAIARPPTQSASDLEEDVRVISDMNARMLRHLDKATGHRAGYWTSKLKRLGHSDLTLDAQEAVDLGLADHVGLPMVALEEIRRVTLTMPETIKAAKKEQAG